VNIEGDVVLGLTPPVTEGSDRHFDVRNQPQP
jgi:hypothetical protein